MKSADQLALVEQLHVANMKQNPGFAFIYNALGIAALAMSLSSASVIGNALRLRGQHR